MTHDLLKPELIGVIPKEATSMINMERTGFTTWQITVSKHWTGFGGKAGVIHFNAVSHEEALAIVKNFAMDTPVFKDAAR